MPIESGEMEHCDCTVEILSGVPSEGMKAELFLKLRKFQGSIFDLNRLIGLPIGLRLMKIGSWETRKLKTAEILLSASLLRSLNPSNYKSP